MFPENRPPDRFEFQGDGFYSVVFKCNDIQGKK